MKKTTGWLEPRLQTTIFEAVSLVYNESLDIVGKSQTHAARHLIVPEVAEAIIQTVRDALVVNYGLENERSSLQNRLPGELWCAVWGYLPMKTRIRVSQTCRVWRALALACPALWTDPMFYTSIYAPGRQSGGYAEAPHGWDTSNICNAPDILARSRALPLRVTVEIFANVANPDELEELARLLQENAQRLASLHVRSWDPAAVGVFLGRMARLSALESLLLVQLGASRYRLRFCQLPLDGLALTAVKSVHLDEGYSVRPGERPCANVWLLSIKPHFKHADELAAALAAFPPRETLVVDLSNVASGKERSIDAEALRRAAERVPAVVLREAGYRSVMRDLENGIRLRIVGQGGDSVAIQGFDAHGRERRIHALRETAKLVFAEGSVRLADVVHITLAASLLDCLACEFPGAATLVLIIDDLAFLDAEPAPEIPCVPRLRTLRIVGCTARAELCAQDLVDMVRVLHVPSPLSALEIDRSIFVGAESELSPLADSVVVGAFRDDCGGEDR